MFDRGDTLIHAELRAFLGARECEARLLHVLVVALLQLVIPARETIEIPASVSVAKRRELGLETANPVNEAEPLVQGRDQPRVQLVHLARQRFPAGREIDGGVTSGAEVHFHRIGVLSHRIIILSRS